MPVPMSPLQRPKAVPAQPVAPVQPVGMDRPRPTLPGAPKAPGLGTPAIPAAPTGMIPMAPPTNVPGGETATISPRNVPTTPAAPPAVPATPAPTPTQGPLVPFTTTPTDPNNPLTSQTIGAGPGLDRFQVAKAQFDNFVRGSDPAYQAALRDAKRVGAAAGGLGSGMLRTSIGDLGNQRSLAMDVRGDELFNTALLGSVDDARFSTGLAERQQGFQQGQQDRAFGNEATRIQIEEALRNGDFSRALQLWTAGQAGGTGSTTALAGANTAGTTAQDGFTALQQWLASRAAQPGPQGPALPPLTLPPNTTTTVGRP